ncbi:MAG: YciI family protein, partial [Bacillota bacterium]|nr:YciI family protein [Bacillota bacterium]
MFIVELTYVKSLDEIDRLREAHVAFLKKYYEKGIFLLSGPKNPRKGGIIIAGKVSKTDLELLLSEDVFFINKAAEYRIQEFHVTLSAENADSFLYDKPN